MSQEKSHYSLDEAAAILDSTSRGLIHLAGKEELVLVVGVPDGIRFRTYDAHADRTEMPALLEPELLELSASQCQKIELNGRTEQSDFRAGYLIAPNGGLQRLMPSYGGRLYLDHGWAFWRTYRGPYIKEIELLPERLFVVGDDIRRLLAAKVKPPITAKSQKRQTSVKMRAEESPLTTDEPGDKQPVKNPIPAAEREAAVEPGSIAPANAKTPREYPLTLIRLPEVRKRTGLSRSTIYDKLDAKSPRYDPTFPKQRNLGTGSVGWVESEIDAWLASRPVPGNSTSC